MFRLKMAFYCFSKIVLLKETNGKLKGIDLYGSFSRKFQRQKRLGQENLSRPYFVLKTTVYCSEKKGVKFFDLTKV